MSTAVAGMDAAGATRPANVVRTRADERIAGTQSTYADRVHRSSGTVVKTML
jgi:hypothetical protein